ncbi:MAG: HlyD family efflux transporter periplasmic adaptor subunit [Candidatus Binatia bacterium]
MRTVSSWRGWAVWAVAAVCAAVLWWRHEPGRNAIPAIVTSAQHRLGAVEPSRVAAVYVVPGDAVRAGQPLVQFDCSEVDAALSVARGRLQEQLADVDAVAVQFADDARRQRLHVETELARIRAALADARGQQEGRQAELTTLTSQLARLDKVMRNRLAEVDRLTALRARQKRLAKQTHHAPEAVEAWTTAADEIRGALERLDEEDWSVRVRPIRARVETQTRRVQQLLERQRRCTLRAPVDGHVSAVFHASGDVVPAGTVVAVVVGSRVRDVTAYVPEGDSRVIEAGGPVDVYARDGTGVVRGMVERVGPEIVEMPPRLWLLPNRPRYGRPVHVRVAAGTHLFPGELAFVRPRAGAAHAALLSPEQSFPMQVPARLRERTRLEPSGLAWLPTRNRFLIVSDDTGFPGSSEHRPWVFTANEDGRFDVDPLPIAGVDAVSDLEAVTRAPDETLYLLASQSVSRTGHRPLTRQWLLRTELAAQGLKVTGKLAVYAQLLVRLDGSRRLTLGVSDQLDIEGMAWYKGGVILGLKAPQDVAGRARLWYLARVNKALAGADSRAAPPDGAPAEPDAGTQLSLFGTVFLPTCAAGAAGGISDLLAEGDQLYILSTLPGGPPCGSAWRIDLPLGHGTPRKLADWPDAKPEGIARAGAGRLLVVFDTGAATPRFAQLQEH